MEEVPFEQGSDRWERCECAELQGRRKGRASAKAQRQEKAKHPHPLDLLPPGKQPFFSAIPGERLPLRCSSLGHQHSLTSLRYPMDPLLSPVSPYPACHFPLLVIIGPLGGPECRNRGS